MASSTQNGKSAKRVLALDDDGTILKVMESALTMEGYESVTASQWVEALDAIEERQPDLLLLDLQMPHVDGIFLLEWMREQKMDVPVIVVSAYLDDDSVARFKELGVKRLIWKPFNVANLIEEVEACIGPSGRETPQPVTEEAVAIEPPPRDPRTRRREQTTGPTPKASPIRPFSPFQACRTTANRQVSDGRRGTLSARFGHNRRGTSYGQQPDRNRRHGHLGSAWIARRDPGVDPCAGPGADQRRHEQACGPAQAR